MKRVRQAIVPPLLMTLVACVHVTGDVSVVPASPPPAPVEETAFSQAELDQMLAPIALYPDVLLSQVLMASTYPLEVVEASRWSRGSKLEGQEAVDAVADMDWDPSIKSLVAFPELIQLMDDNLTWTRKLGDAFLLQQEQVMESIQHLRQVALEEGRLEDMEHLVIEEEEEAIIIEPVDVRVVYVPYYDTRYVFGTWWWYDYPPVCWTPIPYHHSHIGFRWSSGFRVSTSFFWSSCYWPRHHVVVVKPHKHPYHYKDHRKHRRNYREAPSWRHNPYHRRGIDYRTEELNAEHLRRSASGVTRTPMPSRDRMRPERSHDQSPRQALPVEQPDPRIARQSENDRQIGPTITPGTRNSRVGREHVQARRDPVPVNTGRSIRTEQKDPVVQKRPEQARQVTNHAARRSLTSNRKAVSNPTPRSSISQRKSSPTRQRVDRTSRKPAASSSNRVASNSKPQRNVQPQSSGSSSRGQDTRSTQSSRQSSTSSSSSNNSTAQSSNSRWSNNNSYAASRQSRSSSSQSSPPSSRPRPRDP